MQINRYESDRSTKEKIELERQKLKSLSWKKKIQYIATYYKWHFVGLTAVCFVIYAIASAIYNTQYTTVFSAVIINGGADGEPIAEDFKEYCEDSEKFHRYEVNAGMYLEDNISKDQGTLGILLGSFASKETQVLILPEFQAERYIDQLALYEMKELLTEEQMERYGDLVGEYTLHLPNNEKLAEFNCYPGEDAYMVVLTYVEDLTYINQFIEYLMGE